MQTSITPFMFADTTTVVRIVTIDNEPWFVGKDVAEALGYADPTNAMKQHCKGVVKRHPLQTAGGMQEARVLSEPDVLRLIVSSRLPEAERFERWVFEDVLPTIRRTGQYVAPAVPSPATPAEALLQVVQQMVDQERRTLAIAQEQERQQAEIGRLSERVEEIGEAGILTARPHNAESITHIVPRIMRRHGLPERIIREAMRQLPYSPKPAGMVRNEHESAAGSTYAVYWTTDITKVFDRFVEECKHVTATQAVHPFIEGRFKLVGGAR